jgi:uncharacterized protein DUF3108
MEVVLAQLRKRTLTACIAAFSVASPVAAFANDLNDSQDLAAPIIQQIDVAPIESAITSVDLDFEVYGGGLHIVSFGTQAVLTPRSYEIAAQFQTEGLADDLFTGRGSSSASGLLTPDGPRLLTYSQEYDGRFGERSIAMVLDENGRYDVSATPEDGIHTNGFSPSTVRGSIDPLTASIFTAINATANPCDQTIPVFDGRRIFNLEFSELETASLNPEGAGAYQGEAWKCSVAYKPIAGFTRKWLVSQAKDPLKPFTVWMARFDDAMGPAGNQPLVLPVRMMFETLIVNATVHLTGASVDGKQLIAALSD